MFIPKAVFFDLDGVLLDTESINRKIWSKTIEKLGIKKNYIDVKSFEGITRKDCAKLISEFTNKDISIENVLSIHKVFFKQNMKDIKPIMHSEELVDKCLSLNIKLALVTSSSNESFIKKSKEHQWLNKININVLGDNINLKNRKPFPDPYLLAASTLNIKNEECFAIEDSFAGFMSAFNSGCFAIGYDPNGTLLRKLSQVEFDINNPKIKLVSSLKEIINFLK